MLVQLLLTAALAAGLAPCVLQRACPRRRCAPPSTVCMHKVYCSRKKAEENGKKERKDEGDSASGSHPTEHKPEATTGCKNCIVLGKQEKAMFRAHSAACQAVSRVEARELDALLAGAPRDAPALRRHVYCVLLKCKLVGKDGKLLKSAVLGKLAARPDAKNATKVLESCADQTGDTPEDLAWNLFRCGYDKKALLFEYMPTDIDTAPVDGENTN